MFPDGRTGKATKKMLLKHNLRIAAQEMNILPGFYLELVSTPKLVDAGYTMALTKDGAAIYDDNTTVITSSNPPILESDQCQHTGMWRLHLNPENLNPHSPDEQYVNPEMIDVMSSLISQAHVKQFFGTTHHQDSHQRKPLLTQSATETMQHG